MYNPLSFSTMYMFNALLLTKTPLLYSLTVLPLLGKTIFKKYQQKRQDSAVHLVYTLIEHIAATLLLTSPRFF